MGSVALERCGVSIEAAAMERMKNFVNADARSSIVASYPRSIGRCACRALSSSAGLAIGGESSHAKILCMRSSGTEWSKEIRGQQAECLRRVSL
jgi:hypothetical protein